MKKIVTIILCIFCSTSLFANAGKKEVKMCEAAIKSILKSPPSYKRISKHEEQTEITTEDDLKNINTMVYTRGFYELKNKNPQTLTLRAKPVLHSVSIDYYAKNIMGVDLKEQASCDFLIVGKQQGFYDDMINSNSTFSLRTLGHVAVVGVRKDYSAEVLSIREIGESSPQNEEPKTHTYTSVCGMKDGERVCEEVPIE